MYMRCGILEIASTSTWSTLWRYNVLLCILDMQTTKCFCIDGCWLKNERTRKKGHKDKCGLRMMGWRLKPAVCVCVTVSSHPRVTKSLLCSHSLYVCVLCVCVRECLLTCTLLEYNEKNHCTLWMVDWCHSTASHPLLASVDGCCIVFSLFSFWLLLINNWPHWLEVKGDVAGISPPLLFVRGVRLMLWNVCEWMRWVND